MPNAFQLGEREAAYLSLPIRETVAPDFNVLTFSTGGTSHGRYIRARRLRTGWTRQWSVGKHLEMVAHESSHPAKLPRSFPSQAPSLETAEQRGVLTLTVERKEKKRHVWAKVRECGKGKETDRWVFLEHVSKSLLSTCLRATAWTLITAR